MPSLSFITPLALALTALAIPIVLLYMLRLRRTEMPISSTFLWQQLVRDREANAPWQRLRFSWLLLLQLLILLALVLALARPFTEVKTITTGRIVLLLDASASMKATDVDPSRFDQAREIGLDLVDTLGPDDTMTVIQVSAVPEVLAAASRDKLVLRDAIRSAEASDVSADWMAAMTLAAAGAVGVDERKVVVVSDVGLPSDLPTVPGDVRFVQVGEASNNVAISALSTGALPGQESQLFIRISNYGDQDTDVVLDGRLNGSDQIEWAYRYTIPANNYMDVYNQELPENFDTLVARLTQPSTAPVDDYLAADDLAYAVRDRSGAGRVLLITEDNIFLRQIFRSLRGVQLYETTPADGVPEQQTFDLYVFDSWLPDTLPPGDVMIVNPPHSTDFFSIGNLRPSEEPLVAHTDDPRVRNVGEFLEVISLNEFRPLSDIDWATVLIDTGGYPLVVAGEVDNRQVVILPFEARYPNTDFVLQPAWPIMMSELASWYAPPRITDATASLAPGAPVMVRYMDEADEIVVTRPNGEQVRLERDKGDTSFADTTQPGLYKAELRRDGRAIRSEWFAVNLFDPVESQINPVNSVVIGTETIEQDAREETARREFWPWVAAFGLVALVIEWWVYHRSLQRIPRITMAAWRSREPQSKSTPKRPSRRTTRRRMRLSRRV